MPRSRHCEGIRASGSADAVGAERVGVGQRRDRVERRGRARQAGEVGLVADLAAEDRAVDHVGIVDHRMDDRNLLLAAGEAEVIDRARVEEAAIADAGQIELRDRFGRQAQERSQRIPVLGQPVVGHEEVVGQQHAVPAPGPFVVDARTGPWFRRRRGSRGRRAGRRRRCGRAGRCRRRGSAYEPLIRRWRNSP